MTTWPWSHWDLSLPQSLLSDALAASTPASLHPDLSEAVGSESPPTAWCPLRLSKRTLLTAVAEAPRPWPLPSWPTHRPPSSHRLLPQDICISCSVCLGGIPMVSPRPADPHPAPADSLSVISVLNIRATIAGSSGGFLASRLPENLSSPCGKTTFSLPCRVAPDGESAHGGQRRGDIQDPRGLPASHRADLPQPRHSG